MLTCSYEHTTSLWGRISERQREIKRKAKDIVRAVSEGKEEVMTTVVHLSEISNILKMEMLLGELYDFLIGLYSRDNVLIADVRSSDYLMAVELMDELNMDPNDCLAVAIMRRNNIGEIYTFDKGFDEVEGIKRLPPNHPKISLAPQM